MRERTATRRSPRSQAAFEPSGSGEPQHGQVRAERREVTQLKLQHVEVPSCIERDAVEYLYAIWPEMNTCSKSNDRGRLLINVDLISGALQ